MTRTTPRRPRGRPVVGTRKEFAVQALVDAQTHAGVERLIAESRESQANLVRRAVVALLERELQAA